MDLIENIILSEITHSQRTNTVAFFYSVPRIRQIDKGRRKNGDYEELWEIENEYCCLVNIELHFCKMRKFWKLATNVKIVNVVIL